MNNIDQELALRAHIRSQLLEYALTHITTNYITWTEDAVQTVRVAHLMLF